jgi:hypothetical protein
MKHQKRKCSKKNIGGMTCLDVYLLILPEEEAQAIMDKITQPHNPSYPLICWDVFTMPTFYQPENRL